MSDQRELDVLDRGADRQGAVVDDVQRGRSGELSLESRQELAHGLRHLHGVRAGLLEDGQRDRALVVVPGGGLVVLDAADDGGEIGDADRRAVAVRDDHGPVALGVQDLPVGLDGEGRQGPVEDSRREVDVGAADGVGDLVDADAAAGELPRVDLDADGVLLRAVDLHLRHAGDRRDALRHHDLAVLVELGHGKRLRGQGEVHHGLVGRIDLSVGGRRRHVRGKLPRHGRDRRLNIEGRAVQVPRQVELQRDLRRALGRGRAHVVQARDRRELALERSRHRGGHRLGRRSGQRRGNLDRREVHARKVRDGEQPVGHQAEDEDARHHERRRDGAADEELGEVHDFFASAVRTSIFAPGERRNWPSVTTVSPAESPLAITTPLGTLRATVTGRDSTVRSGLTT